MPQKPFQIQGYSLDRFENVSHSLNLETKQSANTKKLHYKEHAGQAGVEDKWSKCDMKKKSKKSICGNSIPTKFSKLTWEFNYNRLQHGPVFQCNVCDNVESD